MLSRSFLTLISRGYCSNVVKPLILARDFFSEERRASLIYKVSKLRGKPVSSRVVDETKVHPSKRASVLVPLVTLNDEPGLLFTTRSSSLRSHGGEISFPGGKFDTELDITSEDTALRETEEELGINRGSFQVWAQLPSLQGRDGKTAVTPIIALLKEPLVFSKLTPNREEVSSVFVCTVAELCQPGNQAFTQFGSGYTLPIYFGHHAEHNQRPKIWGLTAIITHLTLNALAQEMYKFKLPYVSRIGRVSNKK